MPDRDDDDPAPEWFDEMPTVIDARPDPLVETSPHRSLDYLAGREAGYSEGVDRVLAAAARALLDARFSVLQTSDIVTETEQAALRAG